MLSPPTPHYRVSGDSRCVRYAAAVSDRPHACVLDPPLVNGSGAVDIHSTDPDWQADPAPLTALGGYVTKSATVLPREGAPHPRVALLDAEGESLVNAAGLPNPGLASALSDWAPRPTDPPWPRILSLALTAAADIELVIDALNEAPCWYSAVELNLSCPNTGSRTVPGTDPAATSALVGAFVRQLLRGESHIQATPVIAKIAPHGGDPAAVARAAQDAGASAICCGNTLPIRAIADDGADLLGSRMGGLSGRALHRLTLRNVEHVATEVSVPVIGLGGVDSPAAAGRMIDAGACAVGVGTAAAVWPSVVADIALEVARRLPPLSIETTH